MKVLEEKDIIFSLNYLQHFKSIYLEVLVRVIGLVSDGCHSIRLYYRSVIFRMRVTTDHTRVGSVSHGLIEDRLFELSG